MYVAAVDSAYMREHNVLELINVLRRYTRKKWKNA